MAERIRIKCPCCGMKPFIENVEANAANPEGAKVRVFKMTFGGKVPPTELGGEYKKKGRGSAPGAMVVEDVTNVSPELLEKARALIDGQIAKYQTSVD